MPWAHWIAQTRDRDAMLPNALFLACNEPMRTRGKLGKSGIEVDCNAMKVCTSILGVAKTRNGTHDSGGTIA
jgi:hypothetical protein